MKQGRKQLFKKPSASRDEVRAKCVNSLFWTAWYICKFNKISIVLHFAMCLWYERGQKRGFRRFLILVPRGHFKTSLFTIANTIHELIKNPNKRILIVFHNQEEAKKKGRKIKAILRSEEVRYYFPEIFPAANREVTWGATEFSIPRPLESPECSVTCAGVSTGLVGGHYDVIIVDDGIGDKASASGTVMENAVEWLQGVEPLFEDETSTLLVVGTLWPGGPDGFYERLLENKYFEKLVLGCYVNDQFRSLLADVGITLPGDEYTQKRIKPVNRQHAWEDGQPIFPEERTMEAFDQTRVTMGSYVFAHQYLNTVLDEGGRRFQREDFPSYSLTYRHDGVPLSCVVGDVATPVARMLKTLAIDPTGGMTKDSDTAAITVCAWDEMRATGYLLDLWEKKGPSPKDQIEKLIEMAEKWDVDLLIPEHVSMQVWVQAWLRTELTRVKKHYRIQPFKPGPVSKGKRLLDRFHPFVEAHMFFVLPEHTRFVDHMVRLNIAPDGQIIGESPALADTMPMHCEHWRRGYVAPPASDGIRDERDEVKLDMIPRYGFTRSEFTAGRIV